jgi:hypothetical protein
MATRTVQYLIQTDPNAPGGPRRLKGGTLPFDLRKVAYCGMKELLQTCKTGGPMLALMEALLAPGNGRPLVWLESGPGVGAEMRNAWSGLFGRFFARAFLEREGYRWFYPIPRNPTVVSRNLIVQRLAAGEIADWVCARSRQTASQGNVVVAEAKGRHREGTLKLGQLPRTLRNALSQIANTLVWFKQTGGNQYQRRGVKGIAILNHWTNQDKPSSRAILRAVDPTTEGDPLDSDEERLLIDQLGRLFISDLLQGMGYHELAVLAQPPEKTWHAQEALSIIPLARSILSRRKETVGRSFERLLHQQERVLLRFEPEVSGTLSAEQRTDAEKPQAACRVLQSGLQNERFLGRLYGLNGVVELPTASALRAVGRLPLEMRDQFVFFGIRAPAIKQALRTTHVDEWSLNPDLQESAEAHGVFPSADNVIVAPASLVRAARTLRFTTRTE